MRCESPVIINRGSSSQRNNSEVGMQSLVIILLTAGTVSALQPSFVESNRTVTEATDGEPFKTEVIIIFNE